MSLKTNAFEFGGFLLDFDDQVLFCDGKPVPLTPKAFLLLKTLVENHGRVMGKQELMDAVWPDSFVEEGNLPYTTNLLRKTLGDSKNDPRFIETVPRRGYRFICPVEPIYKGRTTNGSEFAAVEPTADPRPHIVAGREVGIQERSPLVQIAKRSDTGSDSDGLPALELKPGPGFRNRQRSFVSIFLVAIAALILVVAGGLIAYQYGNFGSAAVSPPSARFRVSRLTSNGTIRKAALSPDGRFIAYVVNDEGLLNLYVENVVAGGEVRVLPAAVSSPFDALEFSPDGNYLLYMLDGSIFQVPALGGVSKPIVENVGTGLFFNRISFSPDGREFAFIRRGPQMESELAVAAADGSNARKIASFEGEQSRVVSPAWAPDGSVIAVAVAGSVHPNKILAVGVADGISVPIPSPPIASIRHVAWNPDGRSLYVSGTEGRSSIAFQIFSVAYPDGETKNLTSDLNSYESIHVTADGRSIAAVQVDQLANIWTLADGDAANARQVTNGVDRYDGIFSLGWLGPSEIAYETVLRDGNGEIWKVDADGRNSRRVAAEAGSSAVSPDGKYLVLQSKNIDDGATGMFRLDRSSNKKIRLTTGLDVWMTFSPDGRWIYFTRFAEQVALWKVNIDGGEPQKLTDLSGHALAPAISPNGRTIAFAHIESDSTKRPSIALISTDGGSVVKKYEVTFGSSWGIGKLALQWTPDGKAINFISHERGVSNVLRQPLDGGPAEPVTNFSSGVIYNFAYSPDASRLALSRGTYSRDVVLLTGER